MNHIVVLAACSPLIVLVLMGCWYLADMIIPQSEIDKFQAIGRWAKEELERREAERREDEKNRKTDQRSESSSSSE